MDNSIYVALSKQMTSFRDMEVTANNLANVNTVGYQSEQIMFTDYLVPEGRKNGKLAFVQDISSWRDTTSGRLQQTGNPLDVAITGQGYFMVQTGDGNRYTRAGNFTLGADGTLMTHQGYPVLNDGGQRIGFDDNVKQIKIGENGVISTTNAQGAIEEAGSLALVEFNDPQQMLRVGDQLFKTDQKANPAQASAVTQGALEMSNVNPISELIETTKLSRSTSSVSKFVEVMYDLERKTSNAYARASNS